jgi:hypothetical protein
LHFLAGGHITRVSTCVGCFYVEFSTSEPGLMRVCSRSSKIIEVQKICIIVVILLLPWASVPL